MGDGDEGGEVVVGADVEVAGLKDDDCGCVGGELIEGFFEGMEDEAAFGVDGEIDDGAFAQTEEADGAEG